MANLLVVGLNPAWQKVYQLKSLEPGAVNRAQSVTQLASGKGINAARVLKKLGHDVTVLQILGGANGDLILRDILSSGIQSLHVKVTAESRLCTTLVDVSRHNETEIIEPFELENDVSTELADLVTNEEEDFEGVLFMGTLPGGLPLNTYEMILKAASPEFSLVDSVAGFKGEFLNLVNGVCVNKSEYEELLEDFEPSIDSRLQYALVTNGSKKSVLYANAGQRPLVARTRFNIPALESVNTIGSGDAVTAGFCEFWTGKTEIDAACRGALALGSASCLSMLPGDYREEDRVRILEGM